MKWPPRGGDSARLGPGCGYLSSWIPAVHCEIKGLCEKGLEGSVISNVVLLHFSTLFVTPLLTTDRQTGSILIFPLAPTTPLASTHRSKRGQREIVFTLHFATYLSLALIDVRLLQET